MNKYDYILTAGNEVEIHEFINAKDIADAYGKTISVIAKLNKKNSDYTWHLKTLLNNAYFAGLDLPIEDEVKSETAE